MILDTIHGVIDRRILLNYRVRPEALSQILPLGFRPKQVDGWGIVGVCMIRFQHIRPKGIPKFLGMNSENAAHRIAVEWEQDGEQKEGVFIPQRDTNSPINKALGGRIFPGIFNRSQFVGHDEDDSFQLKISNDDGSVKVDFMGSISQEIPSNSIFGNLENASNFFKAGATGYSATHEKDRYHGMELFALDWVVEALHIEKAHSSLWGNLSLFPEGTSELDCALIMRNAKHEWRSRPDLYLSSNQNSLTTRRA